MSDQNWYVKDSSGKIYGPFGISQVVKRIKESYFVGEEKVSNESNGNWIEISQVPEFYDALLGALQGETYGGDSNEDQGEAAHVTDLKSVSKKIESDEEISNVISITREKTGLTDNDFTEPLPPEKSVNKKSKSSSNENKRKNKRKYQKGVKPDNQVKIQSPYVDTTFSQKSELGDKERLTPIKKSHRRKSSNFLPNLIIIITLFTGLYFIFFNEEYIPKGKIHLVSPREQGNRKSVNKGELDKYFSKAQYEFFKHTFSGYYKSQDYLTKLISKDSKNLEAHELLCLTYRELWPYTFQDSKDLSAVALVSSQANKLSPLSSAASVCRLVQQILVGLFQVVDSKLQTVLVEHPNISALYEIKGVFHGNQRDYLSAISLVQRAQQLWPKWNKPYLLEAEYKILMGKPNDALAIYDELLNKFPNHPEANIGLGLIEYRTNQDLDEGMSLVKKGMGSGRVPPSLQSQAYSLFAVDFERRGDGQRALDYAIKAYQLDPTNLQMKRLILHVGGEEALKTRRIGCQEIISLGDHYSRTNNHLAAQAEYILAYETCEKKNSRAALKAAQSLWKLNQYKEAISWAKKAAQADPKDIEPLITLSKFYTSNFDFKSAATHLKQAQKISNQNYLVLQALSNLELKRKNYPAAIVHGEKALNLYDSDIATHLLLSKAYFESGDTEKAYQIMARAVEFNKFDVGVQSEYAIVLSRFQGVSTAIQYINDLIVTYPTESEYLLTKGRIYLLDDQYSEARKNISKAINMEKDKVKYYIYLAQSYLGENDPTNAVKTYLYASQLDPSRPDTLFEIGKIYLGSNDPRSAGIYFKKVFSLNDNYPEAHLYFSKALIEMKDLESAWKEVKLEQRYNKGLIEPYKLAGTIAIKQRDYKTAIKEFQAALKLFPKSVEVYILIARAHRLSGNLISAENLLNAAVRIENGHPEIYKEFGAIYEKQGQGAKAAVSYQKYLNLFPGAKDRGIIEQRILSLGGG